MPAPVPRPLRAGAARWLYLCLGVLFVALAVLGAFLPLLPTTPFVLLASGCFVRSSPRLAAWLRRSRLFGPLLTDWEQHRGVRLHVKVTAVTMIVLAATASLVFGALSPALRIVLLVLAAVGIAVVLRLRTIPG
jgi:uncharacterized membrane protein YbaN (DUF454 family)